MAFFFSLLPHDPLPFYFFFHSLAYTNTFPVLSPLKDEDPFRILFSFPLEPPFRGLLCLFAFNLVFPLPQVPFALTHAGRKRRILLHFFNSDFPFLFWLSLLSLFFLLGFVEFCRKFRREAPPLWRHGVGYESPMQPRLSLSFLLSSE